MNLQYQFGILYSLQIISSYLLQYCDDGINLPNGKGIILGAALLKADRATSTSWKNKVN
jgi:hypothetical protein